MATDRQPMCNNDILGFLADQRGHTVAEMAAHFHVTQTAIRARLWRLTEAQAVTWKSKDLRRRGRPQFIYYLASQGEAMMAEPAEEEVALRESKPSPVGALLKTITRRTEGKTTGSTTKEHAAKPLSGRRRMMDNKILACWRIAAAAPWNIWPSISKLRTRLSIVR